MAAVTMWEERVSLAVARGQHKDRCDFCGGPRFPWTVDDDTWAKVEPLLRDKHACFECFSAAWIVLGQEVPQGSFVVVEPPTGQAAA